MSNDLPVHRPDGSGGPGGSSDPAVLGLSSADRVVLLVGGPVLGLGIGLLLPPVSKWISKAPLPFLGIFQMIASFPTIGAVGVCVVLGFLVGLGLSVSAIKSSLTVTIADDRIELKRDGEVRTVTRSTVETVFAEGRTLVVLDRESRQVVRDTPEAKAARMARAFRAHGYPWADADPYGELYRAWVPDIPDLPAAVNALLAARAVALRKRVARDLASLRDEVEELGFTVREDGSRQFWRPLVPS